jgi:succinyl-diaminopimelate desuccinylase
MPDLAARLAERTLELVDIASESRHEAAISAHVGTLVPGSFALESEVDGARIWSSERRPDAPLVVLAGHVDTVPAQANHPGRVADGAVHGLGASDMKGGVAVALELVRELDAERPPSPYDVGLLLFEREELPPSENPLPELFERSRVLREAALAILLEPTDCAIQAGCVGNLTARIVFRGRSGHAARPWLADNAIERALAGLAPLAALERREAVIDGLPFYEVVTITQLHAGVADNVVPGEATAHINVRYPPDRTADEAEAYLRSLLGEGAELIVDGNSPPADVVADTPLVRRLRATDDLALEPKQAWTNVADFTARGLDAVNFGPGAPRYAHAADEQVAIAGLVRCFTALWRFLTEPAA